MAPGGHPATATTESQSLTMYPVYRRPLALPAGNLEGSHPRQIFDIKEIVVH